jgi:iron complex transport system substrate-binding protein
MAAPRSVRTLVACLVLALAACSGTTTTAAPSAGVGQPASASPAPAVTTPPISYPLTLVDDEGTTVTIPERPTRIVSLTPATTEILFAIGAGSRTVARGAADDYPTVARALPAVASFTGVDTEQIVALRADLVIAGGDGFNPPEAIAKLRSLEIPVVVVYAPTVSAVLDDIRLVGLAADAADAADALAATMDGQIQAISHATDDVEPPTVFYEIDASSKIYTAADQSFLAEMITLAGGIPVTSGSTTSYEIPLEQLIDADPAVVLLGDAAYGVTADQVAARPGWGVIDAVRKGAIYPVDDVVITRPGPRLVTGLLDLVHAIHPDIDVEALLVGERSPAAS